MTIKPGTPRRTLLEYVSGLWRLGGQDSSAYVKQYNIYVWHRYCTDDSRSMQLLSLYLGTVTIPITGICQRNYVSVRVTAVNTFGAEKTDVASVAAKRDDGDRTADHGVQSLSGRS